MYRHSTTWCASIPFTGVKPVKISAQNTYNENQSGFVKLAVVYFSKVLEPEKRGEIYRGSNKSKPVSLTVF